METAEGNVIIAHPVQGFPGKFIAQKGGVAFDKGVHPLFVQQVIGDAFDLLGRAAMQRGDRGGITDIRSDIIRWKLYRNILTS